MYTVTTKAHAREQRTVAFASGMGLLHWALAQRVFAHRTGGVPYPTLDRLYLGNVDHNPGYDYQLIDTFTPWKITGDHLAVMRRALARYQQGVHYLREIAPGWIEGPEEYYADNSIERTDRCTVHDGAHTRRVWLTYPSGDACF